MLLLLSNGMTYACFSSRSIPKKLRAYSQDATQYRDRRSTGTRDGRDGAGVGAEPRDRGRGFHAAVLHLVDLVVIPMGLLPDLDFAATADDADPQGRQDVVSYAGV